MDEVKAPVAEKRQVRGSPTSTRAGKGMDEGSARVQGRPCAFSWPASLHDDSQGGDDPPKLIPRPPVIPPRLASRAGI